jgi:hypothetical protein
METNGDKPLSCSTGMQACTRENCSHVNSIEQNVKKNCFGENVQAVSVSCVTPRLRCTSFSVASYLFSVLDTI